METDLSSLFGGGTSSPIDIMEQLLDPEGIYIKTDLNMKKIRILVRAFWLAEISKPENENKTGMQIWHEIIEPYYLSLLCSLKRKSRTEILDAMKNLNDKLMPQQEGVIPNMLGGK